MENKINGKMTFGELLQKYPESGALLAGYGLHCIGCKIAVVETLEQGAAAHGMNSAQIKEMIEDLNAKCA